MVKELKDRFSVPVEPQVLETRKMVNRLLPHMSVYQVVDRLKADDPPVWTRVREGESWITIHVSGLKEGEDKIVGERIAALFRA